MSRLSLAQQLAQLDDAAPVDFDPEALETYVEDDGGAEGDTWAAREHYLDVGPSELRKLQDSLSDPKYQGVRTSRKALLEAEEEEGSELSDDEFDDDEFHGMEDNSDVTGDSGPEESNGERSDSGDEEEDEDESMEPPPPPPQKSKRSAPDQDEPAEDLSSTLKLAREADKKKGKAVAKQVALWDVLLDSRIQIQKAVVAANKLPLPEAVQSYTEDPECAAALLKLSLEALALADDLTELQEKLFKNNENITPPSRKRRKLDEEANLSNAADDLIAACESAASLEQLYHPQLVQTLTKWSTKIQAVAPSVLLPSNRGTFAKGKQQLKSAVQLVDDALQDHAGLLSRTRLRRTPGSRIKPASEPTPGDDAENVGEGDASAENDHEIFDDNDFYQKMLRDIIDARGGGDGKDADWIAIQKQKKAKKQVDTRASKGRKIRYQVHEKIQNFMVPVPSAGGWHEEQIDELFSSLLGKGFENAVGGNEENTGDIVPQDGFRVFG